MDYITRVLEEAGEPLHESEIARRVIEAAYETRGKTPARTVNYVLNRNLHLFERLGDGYYRRTRPNRPPRS